MSALIDRAAAAAAAAAPRFAARAAVLGRPGDAIPVAAALAGGLREQDRAAGALLVTWPDAAPPRASLATPAASRLATRLQARGLEAVPRGRLAWLAVASGELHLAERALAAVDVPGVLAVTGPRSAASDALLADHDLVVLVVGADAEPGLEPLARASLDLCGPPVLVRGPLDAPAARPAALAGWGRLRLEVPGR